MKKEKMEMEQSPEIVLPADKREEVRRKLNLYKGHLDSFSAPELQMGLICRVIVFERLLADGKVVTWKLAEEMENTYGSGYRQLEFQYACVIAADTCMF